MTTSLNTSATTATLLTTLRDAITGKEGWTTVSGTWVQRVTPAGNRLSINFYASATGLLTVRVYAADNTTYTTLYLPHGESSGGGVINGFVSVGPSHLVIQLEGPRAGTLGAADPLTGSYKETLGLLEFTGVSPADTGNKVVAFGHTSTNTAATTTGCLIADPVAGAGGAKWAQGVVVTALATMKNATGPTGTMVFPYDVVDSAVGLRGRVQKVYAAAPTEFSAGSFSHLNRHYLDAAGERYRVVGATSAGSTAGRSWGTAGLYGTTGAPLICVPEQP